MVRTPAALPPSAVRPPKPRPRSASTWRPTFDELKEGWHYIFLNHTVRAVNIGLATGLIGGGMLIPLGAVFSTEVLGAGAAGYGLFTTALGFGVAIGAVGVSALQTRLPKARVFTGSLFLAGAFLFVGGVVLVAAGRDRAVFVGLMGVSVGPVYVLGFVLLQEEVDDDLRGRVFSSLNTLVRLCVLVSMVAGPLLAALLGALSESLSGGTLDIGPLAPSPCPGVRLTLWLGALIIVARRLPRAALGAVRPARRGGAVHAAPVASLHRDAADAVNRGASTGPLHRLRGRRGLRQVDPGRAARRRARRACSPASRAAPPIGHGCASCCSIPTTGRRRPPGRGAADGGRPGPARGRGGPARPRRGPPRGHRPLRRFVDRLPGLRPGPAARRGPRPVRVGHRRPWPDLGRAARRARRRRRRRGSARISTASNRRATAFHRRVTEGFRALAGGRPERWVVVDGAAPVDEVAAAVRTVVAERLELPA